MFWSNLDNGRKVELLGVCYKPGDSAGELAEKISKRLEARITRHTVLGLYDRQRELKAQFPLRRVGYTSTAPGDLPVSEQTYKVRGFSREVAANYDDGAPGVTVMQVESRHCRWPLPHRNESGAMLFCGHDKASPSGPYCKHHSIRADGRGNDGED